MADVDRAEHETMASTAASLTPAKPRRFEEWRCMKCRTLLAVIAIDSGAMQQRCTRCKTVNVIEVHERIQ